ncbi:hypothetical protein MNV49_003479 [Pseudohyphozyma bogoriensis]|nr:hypothetical protein MNV49_003479 [Pseudohyphozyma bogoriensis]
MLSAIRTPLVNSTRAFSTSRVAADVAKMTLVGRLVGEPAVRSTKNGKEFLTYKVATRDPYVAPKEGEEAVETTSWHTIFAYGGSVQKLSTLEPGSLVYVEALFTNESHKLDNGEYKTTYFPKHQKLSVLRRPYKGNAESE